jgi:hypothetical protein
VGCGSTSRCLGVRVVGRMGTGILEAASMKMSLLLRVLSLEEFTARKEVLDRLENVERSNGGRFNVVES